MNKETRKLLKENNKLEKEISRESNLMYTNIIVYLRGSDINEYSQEKIRRDIINMIVEGEKRGDSMDDTIGADYKGFCDEIISVFPKKSMKEKLLDYVEVTFNSIFILGFLSIIKGMILNLISDKHIFTYTFISGEILSWILIIIIANLLVNFTCKNTFKEPIIKNKVINYVVLWIICTIVLGIIFILPSILNTVILTTNVFVVGLVCVGMYCASKLV